jgi:arylformamidase
MRIEFEYDGSIWESLLTGGTDLSIALQESPDAVNCFWAPPVRYWPVESGSFVGSTARGGPVNFFNLTCNPHGNGTHTECVGHIASSQHRLGDCLKPGLYPALVLSMLPNIAPDGDKVVRLQDLLLALNDRPAPQALILRTLPNHEDKKQRKYSGTNPTYLEAAAAAWMAQNGVEHLLVDLPSVDREEDGGALLAHRAFWQYPESVRLHCTISELLFVPDHVRDGLYLLDIQTAPFDLDVSPSRPIIYPVQPV